MQEMQVQSLDWKDPLEEEMATHFSILEEFSTVWWCLTPEVSKLRPASQILTFVNKV